MGPQIENHPIFPEQVNFEIARVLNRNKIEARVWERGAGETLSCGSGACAIAVIARLKGYAGNEVDIMLPGGNLTINWNGVGQVYLSGLVEEVFTGEWLK
jgi:diaminopimelate epimerase